MPSLNADNLTSKLKRRLTFIKRSKSVKEGGSKEGTSTLSDEVTHEARKSLQEPDAVDRHLQAQRTQLTRRDAARPPVNVRILRGLELPHEALRSICEYCDAETLKSLQLLNHEVRLTAGRVMWKSVMIKACDQLYRRPRKGVDIGYDRHYPRVDKAGVLHSQHHAVVIEYTNLDEFIKQLDGRDYPNWVHNLVIAIPYRSPGPVALTPRAMTLSKIDRLDGNIVDVYLACFMREVMPRYFKNLRLIGVDSGFWVYLRADYNRPEKELRRFRRHEQLKKTGKIDIAGDEQGEEPPRRLNWDGVICEMFSFFPSALKHVHLREAWLSPMNDLGIQNMKTLSLSLGQQHGSRFLMKALPSTLERFDLVYTRSTKLSSDVLKKAFEDCRRLKIVNIECKGYFASSRHTDWIPPSVVEFGRNYSEEGEEAAHYIKHSKLEYLHIHLREHMHPAAPMFFKFVTNLTRLHVIGPLKVELNLLGLNSSSGGSGGQIRQLHVEDMPAQFVSLMCETFPVESLLVERVCCDQEMLLSNPSTQEAPQLGQLNLQELRRLNVEYYQHLFSIPEDHTSDLRVLYFEITPHVQVQDITELVLQKFSPAYLQTMLSVYAGNRVLDLNLKRFSYVDSPWQYVHGNTINDGFGDIQCESMHRINTHAFASSSSLLHGIKQRTSGYY